MDDQTDSPDMASAGYAASLLEVNRCNATALRKAARNVSQLYDARLAATGLRSTQRSILIQVARSKSPPIRELAASLVLNRTALSHNLKPLLRDGYLAVVKDPDDGRVRRVVLTEIGEEKLKKSWKYWREAQDHFEELFGVEQAKKLRDALAVIASFNFDPEQVSSQA